jgi:hypothetical protein
MNFYKGRLPIPTKSQIDISDLHIWRKGHLRTQHESVFFNARKAAAGETPTQ